MITHDLPLKAFSLQPIYLSSYVDCTTLSLLGPEVTMADLI